LTQEKKDGRYKTKKKNEKKRKLKGKIAYSKENPEMESRKSK
jgi:hypothetical protein